MAVEYATVIRRTTDYVTELNSGSLVLEPGQWGYATKDKKMVIRDLSGNFAYLESSSSPGTQLFVKEPVQSVSELFLNERIGILRMVMDENSYWFKSDSGWVKFLDVEHYAAGAAGANGKSIVAITAAMTNATFLTLGIGDLIVNTSSSAVNIGHTSSANTSAAAGAVYEKTASNAVTARGNIGGGASVGGLSGATDLGNTDMNTVTATGFYRVAGGSQSANHYPINGITAWNLAVLAGGNGIMQFASYYGGSTTANKWKIWWRVAHTDSSTAGTLGAISFESSSSPYGWKEMGGGGGGSNSFPGASNQYLLGDGTLKRRATAYDLAVGTTVMVPTSNVLRWLVNGNNQTLTMSSENYMEGDVLEVRVTIDGNDHDGTKIVSKVAQNSNSSDDHTYNIPAYARARFIMKFVMGASRLELSSWWPVMTAPDPNGGSGTTIAHDASFRINLQELDLGILPTLTQPALVASFTGNPALKGGFGATSVADLKDVLGAMPLPYTNFGASSLYSISLSGSGIFSKHYTSNGGVNFDVNVQNMPAWSVFYLQLSKATSSGVLGVSFTGAASATSETYTGETLVLLHCMKTDTKVRILSKLFG